MSGLETAVAGAQSKINELRQCHDAPSEEFLDALEKTVSLAYEVYKRHSLQGMDHGFGVIVGYTPDMNNYFMQMGENEFSENPLSIYDSHSELLPKLSEAAKQDGVILITPDGKITHSGMLIHRIDHESILKKLGKEYKENLVESYGLPPKTHFGSKNTTILGASYVLGKKHPVVGITVNGYMRMFCQGTVLFSTNEEEEQEFTFKQSVSVSQYIKNTGDKIKSAVNSFVQSDFYQRYFLLNVPHSGVRHTSTLDEAIFNRL